MTSDLFDDWRPDLFLVDARNALWRAQHAFYGLSVKRGEDVVPTAAMYGFLRMLLSTWKRFGEPRPVLIAWDSVEGPTVRQALYPEYKRKPSKPRVSIPRPRPDQPVRQINREDILAQEVDLKRLLSLMGIPQVIAPGHEADDIIATLVARFPDASIGILSGDRDLLQLVSKSVRLIRPVKAGKFEVESPETVRAQFQLEPEQILSLKALAGDSSDNIPGARGVGPVLATKILQSYGGRWDLALQHAMNEQSDEKPLRLLRESADQIRLSARLVQLNDKVKMTFIKPNANRMELYIAMSSFKFQSLLAAGQQADFMKMGNVNA